MCCKRAKISHTSNIKHLQGLVKVSIMICLIFSKIKVIPSTLCWSVDFMHRNIISDVKRDFYNHIQRKQQWLATTEKGEFIVNKKKDSLPFCPCSFWQSSFENIARFWEGKGLIIMKNLKLILSASLQNFFK